MIIAAVVFFVGLIMVVGSWGFLADFYTSSKLSLPPGCYLITDGKGHYAWRNEDQTSAAFDSRADAVRNATFNSIHPTKFPDNSWVKDAP